MPEIARSEYSTSKRGSFWAWVTFNNGPLAGGVVLLLLLLNLVHFFPMPAQIRQGFIAGLLVNLLFLSLVVLGWRAEKRARKERRKAEALRFQGEIVKNMSEGVALIRGSDSIILHTNPAFERMFGYEPGELLGRVVDAIDAPAEKPPQEVTGEVVGHLRTAGSWTGEVQSTRKSGEPFFTHVKYSTFDHPAFGPVWLAVYEDVTEQKRHEVERRKLEERLQHTRKLESLRVLAGGVAHDLNNLLTAVYGNVELAQKVLPPSSPVRGNIEGIANAARRAAKLSHQMLACSGKSSLAVEPIDLSDLVADMARPIEASIPQRVTLNYDLNPSVPVVDADGRQIREVLMSLLTNAAEAIGDNGGLISIRTGVAEFNREELSDLYVDDDLREGIYAYLEVADTGCGIDEETKKRIFDPFFSTKFTGRGLGLAATLGVMRSHGGTIKVESEAGNWTSIRVLFPCSERAVAEDRGEAAAEGRGVEGATILVVDDEEGVRAVARKLTELLGFKVLEAADGWEGIEVFRRHADEIALVLLDMTMPRMNGAEAYRELCRIRPGVRVVFSSGYDESDVMSFLAGGGVAGFLQKPYDLEELREAIFHALDD